ncbi:hypothetical protein I7104_004463 [Vibrio parahaemolyticus]|nr:hypothetical protein [Vibrio parahaemolyticus]
MTSLLMKPTSVGKGTRHKLDQPLKKLAYVSNHWSPLLFIEAGMNIVFDDFIQYYKSNHT